MTAGLATSGSTSRHPEPVASSWIAAIETDNGSCGARCCSEAMIKISAQIGAHRQRRLAIRRIAHVAST